MMKKRNNTVNSSKRTLATPSQSQSKVVKTKPNKASGNSKTSDNMTQAVDFAMGIE